MNPPHYCGYVKQLQHIRPIHSWPGLSGRFVLLLLLLAGCNTTSYLPTPYPAQPTTPPLEPTASYWDIGMSVQYPRGWQAFYGAGQLLLAPSAQATRQNPPTQPLVSLQFASLSQLGLDKTATLQQIALTVSRATADSKLVSQDKTSVAALDAYYVLVQEPKADLFQQAIAFRLPDGRVGWIIALTPGLIWANFAPTFETIRTSAKLLRPAQYAVPAVTQQREYTPGGLTLMLPSGWVEQTVQADARLYHAPADIVYQDNSGAANGPQLVANVFTVTANLSAADALKQTLALSVAAPTFTEFSAGGRTGARYDTTDGSTGQVVSFAALPLATPGKVAILRWSVPLALSEVTAPLWESILRQIAFANTVK